MFACLYRRVSEDIETRVLNRFSSRIEQSSNVTANTRRILIDDLQSMDTDRTELLNQLVEQRQS